MTPSLYIHIPFCIQKCDYCDFFSTECRKEIPDEYLESLFLEIQYHIENLAVEYWDTVYIGGGTPSLLSEKQMDRLLGFLSQKISSETKEVTIEMNPESITREKLSAASGGGVTRLSMGIQSFNNNSLKIINRHCTAEKAEKALELVSSTWKGSLNLDSIAGLPGQTTEEFSSSLKKIISYNPDHISLYTLTVEEETPLYRKIQEGTIDFDSDLADSQWILGREILADAGYLQYEVSNFAKSGFESRHNMAYWKQRDYVGAGSGASGTIYGSRNIRWTNTTDISRYIDFWSTCKNFPQLDEKSIPRETEFLAPETREFEFLMMGFRTLEGINSAEYKKRFKDISPWNGSIESRLGIKDGIWEKYSRQKMTSTRDHKDNSTNYALNGKGILMLNQFLIELL